MVETFTDRLDRIASRLGNQWPIAREACINSDRAGRPAFWTLTGAEACRVMDAALTATRSSLEHAMYRYNHKDGDPLAILDNLIPLNHAAVMQLRQEYARHDQYPPLTKLWDRQGSPS